MYPFDRFSESAKGVLTLAQEEAERSHLSYIGTEHLLLGLMAQEDGLAGKAVAGFGLELQPVRASITSILASNPPPIGPHIIPTSRVKRIIEMAFELARSEGSNIVDTGHLLVAIVEEGDGVAAQILRDHGVTVERARAGIARLRQAGQADAIRTGAQPPNYRHRHLDVKDLQGRRIAIDMLFPADYPDAECGEVAARVKRAVNPSEE